MEFHGFRDEEEQEQNWKLTRTFLPHVCASSGVKIPAFTYAYLWQYDVHYAAGGGRCRKWITTREYLIKKIKGEV